MPAVVLVFGSAENRGPLPLSCHLAKVVEVL